MLVNEKGMNIIELTKLDFWKSLLFQYQNTSFWVPIVLSALESIVPPLPMIGIVTLNIAACGLLQGVLFSWIGTCLGCSIVFWGVRIISVQMKHRHVKVFKKLQKIENWVNNTSVLPLFLLIMMPFTPSALMNFAFGISDYPPRKYLITLYISKICMITALAIFGHSFIKTFSNPLYVIPTIGIIILLYIGSDHFKKKYNTSELE